MAPSGLMAVEGKSKAFRGMLEARNWGLHSLNNLAQHCTTIVKVLETGNTSTKQLRKIENAYPAR